MVLGVDIVIENGFQLEGKLRLTKAEIICELKKQGYRLTPQRRAVIDLLTQSHGQFTPATMLEKLRRTHSGIGLVTIYRTLEIMVGLGLACEVHTSSGGRGYTGGSSGSHNHLICSACGLVVNVAGQNLDSVKQRLSGETGFSINSHLLEFTGLCRNCKGKRAV